MLTKVKLVIWDLDDTFWHGTLSEGNVTLIEENIALVKQMVSKGIMISICSKNDYSRVKDILTEAGIWDLFVFPSINWEPKGVRIKNMMVQMHLRAVNVVFLDDNISNLEEVEFYNSGIITLLPTRLNELKEYIDNCTDRDTEYSRLKNYKILEQKNIAMAASSSNEDFLKASAIELYIDKKCMDRERIYELICRSNQLNYTKDRISREALNRLIENSGNESGACYVKDKYGYYGLVGFYCLNRDENKLEHYLFSCRTMGMRIEQYVYAKLLFPNIEVVQPVSVELTHESIDWITDVDSPFEKNEQVTGKTDNKKRIKILLKGPCDMSSTRPYLHGVEIDEEFNYVREGGHNVFGHTHTRHIIEMQELGEKRISEYLNDLPFLCKGDFESNLFETYYDIVFLSLLPVCHHGMYKSKKNNEFMFAYNTCNRSLFDRTEWYRYIGGGYENKYRFTEKELSDLSEKYEFIGMLPVSDIIADLKYIREKLPKSTLLVLILGSEIECENPNTDEFIGASQRHCVVNKAVQDTFCNDNNIRFINITDFIEDQSDFTGQTNHFSKRVYYRMACAIAKMIDEYSGKQIKIYEQGAFMYKIERVKSKIAKLFK